AGEIVAVLGSNGAGKSTLNRVISGVLRATHGSVRFAGGAIEREKPATIVARGLIHVPEGRCIFPNLTIKENLDLGSYRRAQIRDRGMSVLGGRSAGLRDDPSLTRTYRGLLRWLMWWMCGRGTFGSPS